MSKLLKNKMVARIMVVLVTALGSLVIWTAVAKPPVSSQATAPSAQSLTSGFNNFNKNDTFLSQSSIQNNQQTASQLRTRGS